MPDRHANGTARACRLQRSARASARAAPATPVIEHVGDAARTQAFSAEIRRLAPQHYVQTPDSWFPVEPHYLPPGIQFFPYAWQAELLYRISLGRIDRP